VPEQNRKHCGWCNLSAAQIEANEVQTMLEGMDQKLVGVAFSGSYENLIVGQAGMQAGGN
jgi:hypothetical protein